MASGIALHDLSQYPRSDQAAAELRFKFRGHLTVLTVAERSPAQAAGIRPGDSILAINGYPPPAADGKAMSIARSESAQTMLEKASDEGSVTLSLMRGDAHFEASLVPVAICPPRYLVMPKGSSNAWTDGRNIAVTHDLLRIADGDDELAAALAHELAHVIAGQNIEPRSPKTSRRTAEAEADRLSVRIMINAGYDPHAAIRLWERIGARNPFDFLPSATHGSAKSRIRTLADEIAAVETAARRRAL